MRILALCACAVVVLAGLGCASAPRAAGPEGSLAADPVGEAMLVEGEFGTAFDRRLSRDGRLWFSGQPSEEGLEMLARDEGVTLVINLRTQAEMDERVPFDEPATCERLGVRYVHIPIRGECGPEEVEQFAAALASQDGPALVHCAASSRVGGMWAAYLVRHRGFGMEEALERGYAAGYSKHLVDRLLGE